MSKITIDHITLVQTCFACPEQYDAYLGETQVGYFRLRHGNFRVEYPDVYGEEVYFAHPKGDGIFEDDERDFYLTEGKKAILQKVIEKEGTDEKDYYI